MIKVSIFLLILLTYLGLAKTFPQHGQRYPYLKGSEYFVSALNLKDDGELLSIILEKQYPTGIFFKTFIQEYSLIRSYKERKKIIVQVPEKFYQYCQDKIGKSLYRITTYHQTSTEPQPAGYNFIGNPTLGRWKRNSGKRKWHFYSAYKDFYQQVFPNSPLYDFNNYRDNLKKQPLQTSSTNQQVMISREELSFHETIKELKNFFDQQIHFTLFTIKQKAKL